MRKRLIVATLLAFFVLQACTSHPEAQANIELKSNESSQESGKTQIISGFLPGQMKEIGFTKFDAAGKKIEYKFQRTHFRYAYNQKDSLESVFEMKEDGSEQINQENTYDQQGRITLEKHYSGGPNFALTVKYAYNPDGSLSSKESTSKSGGTKRVEYQYLNQKLVKEIRISPPDENVEISYTYNEKNQVEIATYRRNNSISYSETFFYDPNGKIGNKVERAGAKQEISYNRFWQYDPSGNLVQESCSPEDHQGCNGKIVYEWNAANELIATREYEGENLISQIEYRYE